MGNSSVREEGGKENEIKDERCRLQERMKGTEQHGGRFGVQQPQQRRFNVNLKSKCRIPVMNACTTLTCSSSMISIACCKVNCRHTYLCSHVQVAHVIGIQKNWTCAFFI
jgi:hypothetical protein